MLDNMNGVTNAISKHPFAATGSIATLTAAAGLAYVMWDKNRQAANTSDADQEYSENHDDGSYAPTGTEGYHNSPSTSEYQYKRSKKAAIWAGVGFAVSAVLGAAVYSRYATKSNSVASWLPSARYLAPSRMHGLNNRVNTLKQSATSVYDNLAQKAANIR